MSNIFKMCPKHSSRGGEKISRGEFAPLVTGLVIVGAGSRSFLAEAHWTLDATQ